MCGTVPEFTVDFASHADLDVLADLLTELFAQEADFQPDRAKQLAALELILDRPDLGRIFVARLGGRAIGMANALISVSTAEGGRVLILEDVILAAQQRGKGLGHQLLEAVFAWAAGEGMRRITLLTDPDNTTGLRFYGRHGFNPSAMRVLRKYL